MADATTPHFAFPFTLDREAKSVTVVEQDTRDHVMCCENVIVRCPVGFRIDRPEYGIPWPEYRTVVGTSELEAALRRFEPRSNVSAQQIRDMADPSTSRITVNVEG